MHQHPRLPPVMASPARSPQTNPMRTNNPRDQSTSHSRNNSTSSLAPNEQAIYLTDRAAAPGSGASRDPGPMDRLGLIIQNYFYKSALLILHARTSLPPAYTKEKEPRVSRWFNIELPETTALNDMTRKWKQAGAIQNRPPPMTIETYIDLRDLPTNQRLVIMDDRAKRWDVDTALKENLESFDASDAPVRRQAIVLERWICELGPPNPALGDTYPLAENLPKVYKNSIILFRTLYAQLKLMPAWKFYKKSIKPIAGQPMPRLRFRILEGSQQTPSSGLDELTVPLFADQPQVTESISWDPVESPAGQFSVRCIFRTKCDFRIDTPESLFNSQFIANDEEWFGPSLPRSSVLEVQPDQLKGRPTPVGSLPSDRKDAAARRKLDEIADAGPAYGSMSTFHNAAGNVGTSPLSALRAARELHARSPDDDSPPQVVSASSRHAQASSSSPREKEMAPPMPRRTSISFQPFKTPAFSSSVPNEQTAPPSPRVSSVNRPSPLQALNEARKPSVSSLAPPSPKTSPKPAEAVPVSSADSSRPTAPRFSSSFSHRRNRQSISGGSRTDEDPLSSGRNSATSSNVNVQAGAALEQGSGTSLHTDDDDNISDFLKMLDQKKELKSFKAPTTSAGTGSQGTRGTAAALSKFQQLRESHTALSDSLSSSQMLQRSSVSSASRQLANVPPMVAGTSASISSSPGERISPRTPHTPAIPSRLSSNSIIEYNQDARRPRQHRFSEGEDPSAAMRRGGEGGDETPSSGGDTTTPTAGAIPIPTSPRPFHPTYRRSSSVTAQQHNRRDQARAENRYDVTNDLEILPFALRSASMGDGEEREPLSLSALVRLQEQAGPIPTGVPHPPPEMEADPLVDVRIQADTSSNDQSAETAATRGIGVGYRGRGGHHRVSSLVQEEQLRGTSSAVSAGSAASVSRPGTARSGSGSEGTGSRGLNRLSFTRPTGLANFEDDEQLLFALSEQLEGGGSGSGNASSGGGSGSGKGRLAQW